MIVLSEISGLRAEIANARQRGGRIGCVPTMGALHPGHLSLVEECRKHVDYTVLTLFVNPSQFGANEDLSKYPRPIEKDLEVCERAGVDCVFTPEVPSLYPENYATWVEVEGLSEILEGEHRPGHFRGVTTIVTKLFNIVQPDVACFGDKDYQQQTLIRRMVKDLDLPVEIIVCPTIREPDGLAMSSRNVYLSAGQRASAVSLSQALQHAEQRLKSGETDLKQIESEMTEILESYPEVKPQYAVIRDPDTLLPLNFPQSSMVVLMAAYVGQTRLIDHLSVEIG